MDTSSQRSTAAREFRRSLRRLVAATWALPPVVGLSFLMWVVEMFTPRQLGLMMLEAPLPVYVIAAQLAADVYFVRRLALPIVAYLEAPTPSREAAALTRARRFPLDFWVAFIAYLLLAPVAVMASASLGYGFAPRPVDWFRIELVSLVVSIIVGLPIFFLILDLFGRTFRNARLARPHVTIKTKVFLIGALVPLLIDTMLVQYYWTETGYFTAGTFFVWLVLELLAIAGALMFVQSFRQSLSPLNEAMRIDAENPAPENPGLRPQSTDELGVLAHGYKDLLQGLQDRNRVLSLKNDLLKSLGSSPSVEEVANVVTDVARRALGSDDAAVALYEASTDELVVVARADAGYEESGHFRIPRGGPALTWAALDSGEPQFTGDIEGDERVRQDVAGRAGHRSALVCPLVASDQKLGVLIAAFADPHDAPTSEATALFQSIAREVASLLQTTLLRKRQSELEEELRHAQRLEGVGRLAGGISHDFNNILTSILGCASLLTEQLESDRDRLEAEEILQSAERASQLTRQLLAFSRKQVLAPAVVDLNTVISGLYKMLGRLVPSSIDFELELSDGLWNVRADPAQLEQVVLNLVVNARDAIDTHGRVIVGTQNVEGTASGRIPPGQWVALRVVDDGSGIEPDTLERIFEPYFTTKEGGRGTGLGLATVFGIVSQSEGQILVDSKPGEGTTFTALFPRTTEAAAVDPATTSTQPSTKQASSRQTVLVVEDDAQVRRVLVRALRQGGFEVLTASSGDEGWDRVQSHGGHLHLVLSDVVMPGLPGVELARRVREARPQTKVLLMSGYAERREIDEIAEAGLPFVAKPFTTRVVLDRIAALLAASD